MQPVSRFIVTLTDEASAEPQSTALVLSHLHGLIAQAGTVLDTAPEDRALIEALGTVVVEAPAALAAALRSVPGVARVDEDSFRSTPVSL